MQRKFGFANEITYRQWVMTDPLTLMTVAVPRKEFIHDMTDKIGTTFCLHSSVAASQTEVLAKYKESLNEHECAVLAAFTEKYSISVQDVVEQYHWSKDQFIPL
jgi:hypothetical protein